MIVEPTFLPNSVCPKYFLCFSHNNMLKGKGFCWVLAILLSTLVSTERLTFTIVTAVYGRAEGTPFSTKRLYSATMRSLYRKTWSFSDRSACERPSSQSASRSQQFTCRRTLRATRRGPSAKRPPYPSRKRWKSRVLSCSQKPCSMTNSALECSCGKTSKGFAPTTKKCWSFSSSWRSRNGSSSLSRPSKRRDKSANCRASKGTSAESWKPAK